MFSYLCIYFIVYLFLLICFFISFSTFIYLFLFICLLIYANDYQLESVYKDGPCISPPRVTQDFFAGLVDWH